ncbi:hypothetical protein [Salinisphaera sp. PC39]|uniref:hypothetical protein n=1 Tax=Salinisphaera sp. PC39 TaxID=1304156 RepID=UPI0033409751
MEFERDSLGQIIVVILGILIYSVFTLRDLPREISSKDIANATIRNYYWPLGAAGCMLLFTGFEWLSAMLIAIGLSGLGLLTSYRSGFFDWVPYFPFFSRMAVYAFLAYPVLGVAGYYAFSPWTYDDIWWPFMFFFSYLFVSIISFIDISRKFPWK